MASRIMHLAVARMLENEVGQFFDKNEFDRFRFGSLLPDASATKESHFPVYNVDGHCRQKTFDLAGFLALYEKQMRTDPLYLGYYLHLMQDVLFRKMMYTETAYDPHVPGNISLLYEDYRVIGKRLISQFRLTPPPVPDGLEKERDLFGRFPFRLNAFAEELKTDFLFGGLDVPETGNTHFLHLEIAERFLSESVSCCATGIRNLFGNTERPVPDAAVYWWRAETGTKKE